MGCYFPASMAAMTSMTLAGWELKIHFPYPAASGVGLGPGSRKRPQEQ